MAAQKLGRLGAASTQNSERVSFCNSTAQVNSDTGAEVKVKGAKHHALQHNRAQQRMNCAQITKQAQQSRYIRMCHINAWCFVLALLVFLSVSTLLPCLRSEAIGASQLSPQVAQITSDLQDNTNGTNQLRSELLVMTTSHDNAASEASQLSAEVAQLTSDLRGNTTATNQLRSELLVMATFRDKAASEASQLSAEVAQLTSELRDNTNATNQLRSELLAMATSRDNAASEASQLSAEVAQLTSELRDNTTATERLRSELLAMAISRDKAATNIINLGMPKTGSTSLSHFFTCGGMSTSHLSCGGDQSCANCIRGNVQQNRPPLEGCGRYRAWLQMDKTRPPNHCYYPQVDAVAELFQAYPDAVYLLPRRPTEDWLRSVKNWGANSTRGSLDGRLRRCTFGTMGLLGDGDLALFLEDHIAKMRAMKTVGMHLVEFNITNPVALFDTFPQIHRVCWSQSNVGEYANLSSPNPSLSTSPTRLRQL